MKKLEQTRIAALHIVKGGVLKYKSSKTGLTHTYHPHKPLTITKISLIEVEPNEIIIQVRRTR